MIDDPRSRAQRRRDTEHLTHDIDGGRIVFEGTPAEVVAEREGIRSLKGEHLAAYV